MQECAVSLLLLVVSHGIDVCNYLMSIVAGFYRFLSYTYVYICIQHIHPLYT